MTSKQSQSDVITFGCRLNAFESQIIKDNLSVSANENTVVFNTCAVTAEAERQARQAIRKVRRERPDAHIVVTGCAAQIKPEQYATMDEVDLVLGNIEKLQPSAFATQQKEKAQVNDIMLVKETASHLITSLENRARAFVQIQNGCDHRCTFCVIPFGRGNSRSVPMGVIAQQIRTLVEAGYHEVVLTGVDITSYGADLPGKPGLGQLTRRLLRQIPDLPRLRLSSIDSFEVDEVLMRTLAEEHRLMPHLHLSLQSGSDMILKRMKRRHTRLDAIRTCQTIKNLRPDIVFGADLIAGFPTETDEMFNDSLSLIKDCGLTWLHVFPYSARPGTPAARMPQHPKKLRQERAARLRRAGKKAEQTFFSGLLGRKARVIVEQGKHGRTEQFAPILLDQEAPEGALLEVKITGVSKDRLTAKVRGTA
ncbi:MAG: tRNA (N(6)-L-threonylcarbamoyladenosine(37)-C(2))-methylthiotransferase MtaB [Rhodospirillaceae bacterium]|nr:tRNA (N(6)-L-threonylcarbamoyladenosine(37)-C(2))-methylthiotransferase MtaB [Rhodospirillaceae bacterium]